VIIPNQVFYFYRESPLPGGSHAHFFLLHGINFVKKGGQGLVAYLGIVIYICG
jgi:hypothetical protein